MPGALGFYLLIINGITFFAFAADKRAAELGRRRMSERDLLTLAFIGGTPGALVAQQLLRHKTRKEPFRTTLWLLAALHVILVFVVVYRLM